MQGPELGGIVNLPAIAIIAVVAGMLLYGTRESATVNAILVLVKIVALAVFVAVALPAFDAANLEPFSPFGFAKHMGPDGVERGVMAAAAIIFFAFYGFDAIATAAEEAKNPDRDLKIGIVGSMIACVLIYIAVAVAAVGAISYSRFANSPEPLALIPVSYTHLDVYKRQPPVRASSGASGPTAKGKAVATGRKKTTGSQSAPLPQARRRSRQKSASNAVMRAPPCPARQDPGCRARSARRAIPRRRSRGAP